MLNRCFFYRADVTSVYDGDTLTANIDLGYNIWAHQLKVRLSGIDTPEMKSSDPVQRELAAVARDWLRSKTLGVVIYLDSQGRDKYGRWLGKVYDADGVCLNDKMIELGYAVAYDGGTK